LPVSSYNASLLLFYNSSCPTVIVILRASDMLLAVAYVTWRPGIPIILSEIKLLAACVPLARNGTFAKRGPRLACVFCVRLLHLSANPRGVPPFCYPAKSSCIKWNWSLRSSRNLHWKNVLNFAHVTLFACSYNVLL
jgi:hypothetical protein